MDTRAEKEILFSIIMPTFNRAHLIGKAINSVIDQQYPNWELIVVNDGGTDDTEEVVKSYNDYRIRYYWKENEQKGIAKNFGFSLAKGKYVSSFDDDDIMYENHLSAAYNLIVKNDFPPSVYVHYNILNEYYIPIGTPPPIKGDIGKVLLESNPLSNNGVFIQRQITNSLKYLPNPDLKLSADWLLWLQFTSRYSIIYSNEITHGVVAHSQRGSSSAKIESYINNKKIFIKTLESDEIFMKKSKHGLKTISAYYNTYISLFLSLQGNKISAISYLLNGVFENPKEIFEKKNLGHI